MKDFLLKTWNLNRYIVSDDFNKTLDTINERLPLIYHKYPSGKQYFDWTIPKKWIIREAYIEDERGNKILDWKENPLHVVSGSLPINMIINNDDLIKKVYVSDKYPDLIPYIYKFYELDWGFCMQKNKLDLLKKSSKFKVVIDSEHVDDYMYVGEHIIKGQTDKCFIFMAHIDHPAQVNDDLAGAAVLLKLAEELKDSNPYYTLRFLFLPEIIGSIAYISENYEEIDKIVGGIFCEMPGTPNFPLVLQYSKFENTIIDRVARYAIKKHEKGVIFANCFEHVVNDDVFYNSPGIDIPCISISRSKKLEIGDWYHFPFYHTSGDNLENINLSQMEISLLVLKEILSILNLDKVIYKNYKGVPHLSRHNLWVDFKTNPLIAGNIHKILHSMDDGKTIFDISEKENLDFMAVHEFIYKLKEKDLVELKSTENLWVKKF